jgi:lambda repressor-like predicted transcriptional regulator
MDPLDITYRLKRLGKTQSQIARELGVRQGVVSNVIHNRATAYSIASHIAKLLKCEVEELWPDRYCFRPRGPAVNRTPHTSKLGLQGGDKI